MSTGNSPNEGDNEIKEGNETAAEAELEGESLQPHGRGTVPGSATLGDLLRSSSVLSSFQKALESLNAARAYSESQQRIVAQSSTMSAAVRMVREYSKAFNSAGGPAALAASMRWMDQLTPQARYVAQYTATSRLVEQVAGTGALTSWRSALEANSRIEARIRELTVPSPRLSELAQICRVQVDLTDWAVQHAPGKGLLSETSGASMVAWRNLVSASASQLAELPAVVATGRTNLSLLGSDLLDSPDADAGLIVEGADRVESEVVEPWMAARLEVTAELYVVLARIDAKIPALLNGAWDDVRRNGPAAAEKAANCAVEAVERALRAAAPDDVVRAWHVENKRPAKEWENQDRPPHALRVRYLARNFGGPRALVESQGDAFAAVVGRLRKQLQAAKHASRSDLTAVRTLLVNAENLLITLLVDDHFPQD